MNFNKYSGDQNGVAGPNLAFAKPISNGILIRLLVGDQRTPEAANDGPAKRAAVR